MFTLRCSKKLLDFMDAAPEEPKEVGTTALGDWYGNVIDTARGKLIIFINEKSLLTVAVVAKEVKAGEMILQFLERVEQLFYLLNMPQELIQKEFGQMDFINVTSFKSHRMSAIMGSIGSRCQRSAERDTNGATLKLSEVEISLANIPYQALGFKFPSEIASELLLTAYK